jgi:hypothetical protein
MALHFAKVRAILPIFKAYPLYLIYLLSNGVLSFLKKNTDIVPGPA